MFNLITEQWIPVQRQDGTICRIAPWQITKDLSGNPIIALNAPRPDFTGALVQFLIGLVQTALPTPDSRTWKKIFELPPSTDQLKSAFSRYESAFNLDGDVRRFMQDMEMQSGKKKPIERLLIETPREEMLKDNTDHFLK